jgi:hypothetical protein
VGNDTASLTGLLGEFGALWEITKTPKGFTARRRPPPAPPLVFTAATVPALRDLLEHGYDTGKLAGVMRDFGGQRVGEGKLDEVRCRSAGILVVSAFQYRTSNGGGVRPCR